MLKMLHICNLFAVVLKTCVSIRSYMWIKPPSFKLIAGKSLKGGVGKCQVAKSQDGRLKGRNGELLLGTETFFYKLFRVLKGGKLYH